MLDVEGSGNTQNHAEHDIVLFSLAVREQSFSMRAAGKIFFVTSFLTVRHEVGEASPSYGEQFLFSVGVYPIYAQWRTVYCDKRKKEEELYFF